MFVFGFEESPQKIRACGGNPPYPSQLTAWKSPQQHNPHVVLQMSQVRNVEGGGGGARHPWTPIFCV